MEQGITNIKQASGAPEKLILKGRNVTVSPLGVAELVAMESWISEAPLRRAMSIINSETGRLSVTEENRDKLVYEAVKEGAALNMKSEEGQAMLESLSGVRFVLWLSMVKTDKSLTQEDVFDLVDLDNLKTVSEALDRVSGLKEIASGE